MPIYPLSHQLSHVYWIGGSPCSGKTSTAQALAKASGWRYFSCDDAFYRHAGLISPETQPVFDRVMHYSSEELWMRPVENQLNDELQIYREEFPLILADLLNLAVDRPVIAEGAALLPELVGPLLGSPHRAIWMVPTAGFQIEHYSRREWAKDIVKACSDPKQAFENWMERDIRFALEVRRQAERLGLRVLVVDGSQSPEQSSALVKAHLEWGD
jgi:hypothetical protein